MRLKLWSSDTKIKKTASELLKKQAPLKFKDKIKKWQHMLQEQKMLKNFVTFVRNMISEGVSEAVPIDLIINKLNRWGENQILL